MNSQKKSIAPCAESVVVSAGRRRAARAALSAAAAVALVLAGCASGGKSESDGASGTGSVFGGRKATNWEDYKRGVALKLLAAHPKLVHNGAVEQPALAIPVLKVSFNADGSVRRVDIVRHPSQARETEQVAVNALRNSGPYGSVEHLPKPWEFTEAFVFNEDGRFKPSVLDR